MDTAVAPKVSIILPTYNGKRFIAEAIQSVQNQTYTNWELLIIDDGSKDSVGVIKDQFIDDVRILFFFNEVNSGIQKSLNRGIALARGVYIARIDDDDCWIDPTKLEQQVSFLDTHQACGIVGTGAKTITDNGIFIANYLFQKTDIDIRHSILYRNPFIHSSVLLRKKIVEAVGGYSEDINVRFVEDYELWLRMGRISSYFNLPIIGVQLRRTFGKNNHNYRILQAKNSLMLICRYKKIYPQFFFAFCNTLLRWLFFRVISFFPRSDFLLRIVETIYRRCV